MLQGAAETFRKEAKVSFESSAGRTLQLRKLCGFEYVYRHDPASKMMLEEMKGCIFTDIVAETFEACQARGMLRGA